MTTTISSPGELAPRPDWVRRLNAFGTTAGGAERLVPFDIDEMRDSAVTTTGFDDFGDVDGDWLGRLRGLVAALDDTAELHAVGRFMTRAEIMRCLRTRLILTEDARQRPGVRDEVVTGPVVVTGPARSGTSLLLELLDLDPTLRGPQGGEIVSPGPADDVERADRLRLAESEYELWADVQPGFTAVHDLRAAYPQECIHVQMPSFSGVFWSMVANIPGWSPDPVASMQFHRSMLQSLQHGANERTWVLKTPVYLAMLDLVFATYPDAWVLHSHRDPVKTAVSGASTLANVRWIRSDHVETSGIAGDDSMGGILLGLMQRRANHELPDRIIDVHFAELMTDPAAAVAKAYDAMGRDFTGTHADAIRRYVADRPSGSLGKHVYKADEFGLDSAAIRERMRPYTDYYKIALE